MFEALVGAPFTGGGHGGLWIIFGGLALLASPLVAQLLARRAVAHRRILLGVGRAVMPAPPDKPVEADFQRGWLAKRDRLITRIIQTYPQGLTRMSAEQLAEALGQPLPLVESALSAMRTRLPHRLRVTRAGHLLHDFSAEAFSSWRSQHRSRWLARLVGLVGMLIANLAAAFPLVLSAGLLVTVLVRAAEPEITDDAIIELGVGALLIVATLAFSTWLIGLLLHTFLSPKGSRLKLATLTKVPESASRRSRRTTRRARSARQTTPFPIRIAVRMLAQVGVDSSRSSGSRSSSSSSSSSKKDNGAGILVVIVLILVIVVLSFVLYMLFSWARGVWRAAFGPEEAPPDLGPADWVRASYTTSKVDELVPTNELVVRLARAIRRGLPLEAPADAELEQRVARRAARLGGWLPLSHLVLYEGLAPDVATQVGARLVSARGGEVELTEQGDLYFRLPGGQAGRDLSEEADEADEYLHYAARSKSVERLPVHQKLDGLPSNLPGVHARHLRAGAQLTAGAVVFAGVSLWLLSQGGLGLWGNLGLTVGPVLVVLSCSVLVSVAGYVCYSWVHYGVVRDVRRQALRDLAQALDRGEPHWRPKALEGQLMGLLASWAPDLDERTVWREILAVAVDLELDHEPGDTEFELSALRERLKGERAYCAQLAARAPSAARDEDDVVYDTGA